MVVVSEECIDEIMVSRKFPMYGTLYVCWRLQRKIEDIPHQHKHASTLNALFKVFLTNLFQRLHDALDSGKKAPMLTSERTHRKSEQKIVFARNNDTINLHCNWPSLQFGGAKAFLQSKLSLVSVHAFWLPMLKRRKKSAKSFRQLWDLNSRG